MLLVVFIGVRNVGYANFRNGNGNSVNKIEGYGRQLRDKLFFGGEECLFKSIESVFISVNY